MNSIKILQPLTAIGLFLLSFGQSNPLFGQDSSAATKTRQPIEILDEPTTVDPATLVPPKMATLVTVKFDGQPLKDVFTWLRREQSINVLVDYKALASVKLLDTEPIYEELNNAPLYLLLNRLEALGMVWYEQDDTLQFTSREVFQSHDSTIAYNLGDLIDAGYSAADLVRTVTRCSGGVWGVDGTSDLGTADFVGDVVFIRQKDQVHREVAGLLAALRKHGRRTFTLDAPENAILRAAVAQKISVDFQESPLTVALLELSRQAGINIRLDHAALVKGPVRERTPVSSKLDEQKLGNVLRSLLSNLGLTWYLRDGVMWISKIEMAGLFEKTAVYDVRDLCETREEAIALKDAILKQTRVKWQAGPGPGPGPGPGVGIEIPKPGVLVARHSESALDEILQLLENYRTALRSSKLRVTAAPGQKDPNEVVTGYYRLTQPLADEIESLIQKMVFPETWKTADHPDEIGSILKIPVQRSVVDLSGSSAKPKPEVIQQSKFGTETVVLVIRQSRTAHQAIGKFIKALIDSSSVDVEATQDLSKKIPVQTGTFGQGLIPAAAK